MTACKRLFAITALVATLVASACAPVPIEPLAVPRVFIVRHAEKLPGPDPALSEAGQVRALALARLLDEAGITRIFSTDTRRTRSTANPLAQRLGLAIEIYDHREQRALAERIRSSGETVLVVGHSNTIGELAVAFGIEPGSAVSDDEYDRLYVIRLAEPGVVGEIRRFGETAGD